MKKQKEQLKNENNPLEDEEKEFYGNNHLELDDFDFTISKEGEYELDVLQQQLLNFYVRADIKFRKAYHTDYTAYFIQFLKDKSRLREPTHISIMGTTRSGKSYSAISLQAIQMAFQGKLILPKYICGNSYSFLERVQSMPLEHTTNTCFLRDEDKQPFGIGSIAKKTKLQDVANIVAKHNISTISLCPTKFSNTDAHYGLRTFGRNFKNKSVRFMLYNLQENKSSALPLGMVYLPIFTKLLPKWYAEPLEKAYVKMKDDWIEDELKGQNDVLFDMKKKTAEAFARDRVYLGLQKKTEKLTYISMKLGAEWTKSEKEEIFNIINLLSQGISIDD